MLYPGVAGNVAAVPHAPHAPPQMVFIGNHAFVSWCTELPRIDLNIYGPGIMVFAFGRQTPVKTRIAKRSLSSVLLRELAYRLTDSSHSTGN
jgi:hypothetical protein